MVPSNKSAEGDEDMTSTDERGKGWSWTTKTMTTTDDDIASGDGKLPQERFKTAGRAECRQTQTSLTKAESYPSWHTCAEGQTVLRRHDAHLEPFCKHFEK